MTMRLNARDRLARLLSVIPWVAEHPEGAVLDDISRRFDYPRAQLLDDLQEVVFFVGVHPFTPDSLIEVEIADERVHIRYADWFSRPLRLTSEEGARLLTTGRSVLALGQNSESPDDDNETTRATPLLRALTKLGTALGESAQQVVEVRLGDAPTDTLSVLRDAITLGMQVQIEYYTYGRDELTERVVEPGRLFSDQGNWYLSGWCHRAGGERVFRVDRIRSATPNGRSVSAERATTSEAFSPSGDDPRIELSLQMSAKWVIEQYPTEEVTVSDDQITVRMAVTAVPWLERLLLRLGPSAEVISLEPPLSPDLTVSAAKRILERYQC